MYHTGYQQHAELVTGPKCWDSLEKDIMTKLDSNWGWACDNSHWASPESTQVPISFVFTNVESYRYHPKGSGHTQWPPPTAPPTSFPTTSTITTTRCECNIGRRIPAEKQKNTQGHLALMTFRMHQTQVELMKTQHRQGSRREIPSSEGQRPVGEKFLSRKQK